MGQIVLQPSLVSRNVDYKKRVLGVRTLLVGLPYSACSSRNSSEGYRGEFDRIEIRDLDPRTLGTLLNPVQVWEPVQVHRLQIQEAILV